MATLLSLKKKPAKKMAGLTGLEETETLAWSQGLPRKESMRFHKQPAYFQKAGKPHLSKATRFKRPSQPTNSKWHPQYFSFMFSNIF